MKSKALIGIVFVAFILSVAVLSRNEAAKGKSEVQSEIDAIAMELSNRTIGKIEILQIPPYIETFAPITPERLERSFHYRLTIQYPEGGYYSKKLTELLKSLKVQPRPKMANIRWGIIFYDAYDSSRAGAIYFDKFGKDGAVGDIPVSFKGGLFKWLDGNCSRCFR